MKNIVDFLIIVCVSALFYGCGLKNEDEDSGVKVEFVNSEDTNTDWIEIGKVSAVVWNYVEGWNHAEERNIEKGFLSKIELTCWYKLVNGEKVYSTDGETINLTKNTYKTVLANEKYVDVSGYNYQVIIEMDTSSKTVCFVSLP